MSQTHFAGNSYTSAKLIDLGMDQVPWIMVTGDILTVRAGVTTAFPKEEFKKNKCFDV